LTLLLDLDVATGFERIAQRYLALGESADRFEKEDRSFHERIREGYLKLAKEYPKRFRIINAAKKPAAVATAIWDTVNDVFRQSI
jgi:dTMP kinase